MELFLVWMSVLMGLQLVSSRDFTYKGSMGPEHWAEEYSTCNGKLQSPINIYSDQVKQTFFPKLIMQRTLERPIGGTITNNGHTVVIKNEYASEHPQIHGGPLKNETYRLVQMHFHWGRNNLEGSEDRINNKSYPAELHVVWSNIKYPSYDEAIKHDHGIVVFAYFIGLSIYNLDNPGYAEIIDSLEKIRTPNASIRIPNPPSLFGLFSIDKAYFTYNGSLTTPPCSEDVIWIDFEDRIDMSSKQIENFRHLLGPDGTSLNRNFRPTQPLNNRTIYFHAYDMNELNGIPFIKSGFVSLNPNWINIIMRLSFILVFIKTMTY